MNVNPCPNQEKLSGFVLGTVSDRDIETVMAHLTQCGECEATVRAMESRPDTVIAALRESDRPDAYGDEPECRRALASLHADWSGRSPAETGDSDPDSAKKPRRIRRLGDYRLMEKLGEGGMGAVYRAEHIKLKRVVALKVLPKERWKDEQAIARFEREMEAIGRLDHPNIVRAMDAREIQGIRFLVMEFVEGMDLSELVRRRGPLPVADACELIRQAALGLQYSHQQGLVHRDIKPSNLMLTNAGQIKVLDLGLARLQEKKSPGEELTGAGQVMGTVDYMSPEQAMETRTVDIRTDIYSLGCTLYRLLVGHAPFGPPEYDTPMQKVMGHARDPVPSVRQFRAEIPEALVAVIERMLAKDPDERFATPAEVSDTLARFCNGSDLPALLTKAGQAPQPAVESASPETGTEPEQASAHTGTSSEPPREAVLPEKPPIAPPRRKSSDSGLPVLSEEPRERFAELRSRLAAKRPSARVWIANWLGGIRSRFAAGKPPARVWIATGAAAAALFLLSGIVLYVATNKGTIKITLSDPKADIVIKVDGEIVEIAGLNEPLRLWVGKHGLVVIGKDYETVSKSFTIRRGDNPVLEVVLVPKRPPAVDVIPEEPPPPPETIRPEKTLAKWGYVMRVLFVPDNSSHAVFLKLGGKITRWDLGTEDDVFQFDGIGSWVARMVVSADGGYLLCGADPDNTFRLMDMNTGKEIRRFQGLRATVGSLAISADGRRALSADWDGNVCLWNVETGERLSSCKGHGPLAFAPDDRHVLFTCRNATTSFCLYDVIDGKEVRRFKGHEGNLHGLTVSPDGRRVLSASGDATARLWDVETGREVVRFKGHTEGVGSATFSPHETRVLTSSGDKTIRVWDIETGHEIYRLTGHREPIHSAVFSPDGRCVLSCGKDESRIWRLPEPAAPGPAALSDAERAEGWRLLFDGKTLTGWQHQGGKAYVEDGALVSDRGADLFYAADWSECALECELQGNTTEGTAICCLQLGHTGMGRGLHRVRLMFHRTGEVEVEGRDGSRLWKSGHGKFPLDDWLRLRVEMTRDKLLVSPNGEPVCNLNIDAIPARKGGLYVFSFGGSTARLRNVRLKAGR